MYSGSFKMRVCYWWLWQNVPTGMSQLMEITQHNSCPLKKKYSIWGIGERRASQAFIRKRNHICYISKSVYVHTLSYKNPGHRRRLLQSWNVPPIQYHSKHILTTGLLLGIWQYVLIIVAWSVLGIPTWSYKAYIKCGKNNELGWFITFAV